eukprot:UN26930
MDTSENYVIYLTIEHLNTIKCLFMEMDKTRRGKLNKKEFENMLHVFGIYPVNNDRKIEDILKSNDVSPNTRHPKRRHSTLSSGLGSSFLRDAQMYYNWTYVVEVVANLWFNNEGNEIGSE